MRQINISASNEFHSSRYSLAWSIFLLLFILLISMSSIVWAGQQEDLEKSIEVINPRPDFSLSLRLDKETGARYAPGEGIRIYFRTSQDAYVTIFGYDSRGDIRLLFPNRYQRDHYVEANREYHIEGIIEAGTPGGREYIQGFATTEPVLVNRELERRLAEEVFPVIEEGISRFTLRIRGILSNLPARRWVSSEILSYQVAERRRESGQLRVNSSPSGADVYLNDRHAGETPLRMEAVRAGEYVLRVEQAGYHGWERRIRIHPDRTTTMHADLERIRQYGSIAIRCNQNDARIYLDGQYQGLTDKNRAILLEDVNEGSHEIRVTLAGYHDWNRRIEVRPNERVRLTVDLERITRTGNLEVSCNVDDADIYVDGKYRGRTLSSRNVTIRNIQEGTHELRMVKEGYRDYTERVRIDAGETHHIHVRMQPERGERQISARIDIDPDTLNLKSHINWITVYIDLPANYEVEDININTVRLSFEGKSVPVEWGDSQKNILMVKFDGDAVKDLFGSSVSAATLRVSGELVDGTIFSGSDTIRVLKP